MSNWETIFFWAGLVIYVLASGGYIHSFVFRNPRILPKVQAMLGVGLAAHTAAIMARYVALGHLPWAGDYETALMGGWFLIAATLVVAWRNRALQGLATFTVPLVIFLLVFGFMRNPVLAPMPESLKSPWLYVHVYFAWLTFCAYTLAMAAGILFLLKKRTAGREVVNPFFDRFPSLERLDELIFQYVVFGFIADSIMITAGAIWAKNIWGSYWSWDPIETLSLVSYMFYGLAIHLRITLGWRDERMAWLVVIALSTVIVTFFGVSFLMTGSLHVFNLR